MEHFVERMHATFQNEYYGSLEEEIATHYERFKCPKQAATAKHGYGGRAGITVKFPEKRRTARRGHRGGRLR